MENIWSENKKINSAINILLFLMAMNFFHYGQILIPIICVILFIDNKCKFKVNNLKTFIILCLFGITFLAFSYKMGAYSFIGLFLPMVYYIGSNMKVVNEDNIKHIIYLLTLGMGIHVVFNFATDIFVRGFTIFSRNSHLDFWTQDEFPTTQTSVLYMFIIGIIYYVYSYEKNDFFKKTILIVFVIMMLYEVALGRRTPLLIFIVVVYCSAVYDCYVFKNRSKILKLLIIIGLVSFAFVLVLIVIVKLNPLNLSVYLHKVSIIRKFIYFGFESGRLNIFKQAMELAPTHLFGGREISDIVGWDIHDLWFDTFDYAGIVPFIILVIHSILSTFTFIKFYKNKNISRDFKFLISTLYGVVIFQMFIEPIMTGSSIFLLCSVIVYSLIENLTNVVK